MDADVAELASCGKTGICSAHAARDEEIRLPIEVKLHLVAHLALQRGAAHDSAKPVANAAEHRCDRQAIGGRNVQLHH
jgi:hypothetical protein